MSALAVLAFFGINSAADLKSDPKASDREACQIADRAFEIFYYKVHAEIPLYGDVQAYADQLASAAEKAADRDLESTLNQYAKEWDKLAYREDPDDTASEYTTDLDFEQQSDWQIYCP